MRCQEPESWFLVSVCLGGGGGGGGTACLKVGTYCQTMCTAMTFSGLSAHQFSLSATYFWRLQTSALSNQTQYEFICKNDSNSSQKYCMYHNISRKI